MVLCWFTIALAGLGFRVCVVDMLGLVFSGFGLFAVLVISGWCSIVVGCVDLWLRGVMILFGFGCC